MKNRVIVIYLEDNGLGEIEQIRRQYDPLFPAVKAHITLVFPFESDLTTNALRAHVRQAAQGIGSFPVQLQTITGQDGRYLFLNVKQGKNQLISLHDKLYSGILKPYRHNFNYLPHVTVGRFQDRGAFLQALAATRNVATIWQTTAQKISIVLTSDNHNQIETVIKL
ncbi:MAG TPA: 2'-5' RNA ligase family protein [Anaerolineae bacterium]|nr:2'-5' RNA ligase family protein [Anaerolineae bacterium]